MRIIEARRVNNLPRKKKAGEKELFQSMCPKTHFAVCEGRHQKATGDRVFNDLDKGKINKQLAREYGVFRLEITVKVMALFLYNQTKSLTIN